MIGSVIGFLLMKKSFFILLSIIFLGWSLVPVQYELSKKEEIAPHRSFELVHNYITDYNFYLSRIRQGFEGRFTVQERYTTEPHNGSLIQVFYLYLGTLARVFTPTDTVGVPAAYWIACILFAFLVLSATVWMVRRAFMQFHWQIIAFLLAITACGYPIVVMVGDTWRFGGYMSWFTLMDTLQRITFLPHVLAGQLAIIVLFLGMNDTNILRHPLSRIVYGCIALLLGMIFPPGLVFVGVGLVISVLVDTLWHWNVYIQKHQYSMWLQDVILPRLMIGIISVPALIYYVDTLSIYPWKSLAEFDALHPMRTSIFEYVKALGPVLPLGIFGLGVAWMKKESRMVPSIAWVISWILLYAVFTFIPQQSPLRFAEMAPQIPLAVLLAYGCVQIVRVVEKKQKHPYLGVFAVSVPLLYIVLGLGVMYSSWLWHKDFVDQKVAAEYPEITMNNYIVYPTQAFMDGITYIKEETNTDAVILSFMTAGNYIPAYTGRTVYIGHDNTVHVDAKKAVAKSFFKGIMEQKEAYVFLRTHGISHVFVGPQELELIPSVGIAERYPFLRTVFERDNVTIYEVL